jgi:hypothetical protein
MRRAAPRVPGPSALRAAGVALVLLAVPPAAAAGPAPAAAPPALVWLASVYGSGDGALRWPAAVASAVPDEILVADAFKNRAVLFREVDGAFKNERVLSLPGAPAGVTATADRYLIALRGPAGLVAIERKAWTLRSLSLPKGAVPGGLAAAAEGATFLLDAAVPQAVLLSPSGVATRRTPLPERTRAIVAAAGGGLLAAAPDRPEIVRCAADGTVADRFPLPAEGPVPPWPAALAADAAGRLLVVDRHGARILLLDASGRVFGAAGRKGWENGAFLFPSAVAVLSDGRVVVADQGNGRLQIFRTAPEGAR